MLSHAELAEVISTEYPSLSHGVDFWVGHVVDRGSQVEPAFIAAWNSEEFPKPSEQDIEALLEKHSDVVERVRAISSQDVNAERDRRIASGFSFMGNKFDFDMQAKTNISGAAQMAFMAIVSGAQPGDYRWGNPHADFAWITQDNEAVPMDAQTVVNFGKAAAFHEQAHIMAARALKDASLIPPNYESDQYWPTPV